VSCRLHCRIFALNLTSLEHTVLAGTANGNGNVDGPALSARLDRLGAGDFRPPALAGNSETGDVSWLMNFLPYRAVHVTHMFSCSFLRQHRVPVSWLPMDLTATDSVRYISSNASRTSVAMHVCRCTLLGAVQECTAPSAASSATLLADSWRR
jgi:hypothetical protein